MTEVWYDTAYDDKRVHELRVTQVTVLPGRVHVHGDFATVDKDLCTNGGLDHAPTYELVMSTEQYTAGKYDGWQRAEVEPQVTLEYMLRHADGTYTAYANRGDAFRDARMDDELLERTVVTAVSEWRVSE